MNRKSKLSRCVWWVGVGQLLVLIVCVHARVMITRFILSTLPVRSQIIGTRDSNAASGQLTLKKPQRNNCIEILFCDML